MVGYNIPYVCPSWSYHWFVCARCTKLTHTYAYHRCNVCRMYYMCIYVSACTAIISTLYLHIYTNYIQAYVYYAFKSSNYPFRKFFLNPPNILKLFQQNRPFNYNPCKLANKHKENYIQLQITTLNRHETLSTAKDFLNCSHRNEKYLIVGLSLDQGRCIMAWKADQQP